MENNLEQSVSQEENGTSVNQNPEASTPAVEAGIAQEQQLEQPKPVNKVEQRIRKLANEKNELRDEVQGLREELVKLTTKPIVEPVAEDYGEDVNAFVDAKLEYKLLQKQQEQQEAHAKRLQAEQQREQLVQSWQDKIDSLPEAKRATYSEKVTIAQSNGTLNLPNEILSEITQSTVGPEVLLEVIDNPNLQNAINNARSVGEVAAIIKSTENHFAAQRFGFGANPVQSQQNLNNNNITNAPAAMPEVNGGVSVTDPKQMSAADFRQWYKANRK